MKVKQLRNGQTRNLRLVVTPLAMFLVCPVQGQESPCPLPLPLSSPFSLFIMRVYMYPSLHPYVHHCASTHPSLRRLEHARCYARHWDYLREQDRCVPCPEEHQSSRGRLGPLTVNNLWADVCSSHILARFTTNLLAPWWPLGHKRKVSSGQMSVRNSATEGSGGPQVSHHPQNCQTWGPDGSTQGVQALRIAEQRVQRWALSCPRFARTASGLWGLRGMSCDVSAVLQHLGLTAQLCHSYLCN